MQNLTNTQNKTSCAVQVIHQPTGVVVKCQETRSRSQNRKIARRLLAEKVDVLVNGDKSHPAWKEQREKQRRASKVKKSRRKYRALERMKEGEADQASLADHVKQESMASQEVAVR